MTFIIVGFIVIGAIVITIVICETIEKIKTKENHEKD